MKMKYFLLITSFLIFLAEAKSQTEINNSIKPVQGDSLRIENVGIPNDSTELVSVKNARNNLVLFYTATNSGDTLFIQTDSSLFRISEGCVLYVQSNLDNSGSVSIKVNGVPFLINKNNDQALDRRDIIPQKILVLVYSENKFILMNPERPKCPSGFVQVNDSYCIEVNERQASFWNAIGVCNGLGARLCSWSEWYYACQKGGLGLTNLTNNWEWVNQGQNEPYTGKVVGSGKCNITTHQNLTANIYYRCCFSY
jgi:hypothetical protein